MKGKKDYKNGAPQKTLLEMFLTSKPVQVDLKTFESERKESIIKQRQAFDCTIETLCSNSQGGILLHYPAER